MKISGKNCRKNSPVFKRSRQQSRSRHHLAPPSATAQRGSGKIVTASILAVFVGVLAIAVMLLPRGFKDDLTLIGQGTPAIVLTHDKNLVSSTQAMELLNRVRPDYKGQIQFLAVDVVTPTGINFSRGQQVGPVQLVMFNGRGDRQQVLSGRLGEAQLRNALDQLLMQ